MINLSRVREERKSIIFHMTGISLCLLGLLLIPIVRTFEYGFTAVVVALLAGMYFGPGMTSALVTYKSVKQGIEPSEHE